MAVVDLSGRRLGDRIGLYLPVRLVLLAIVVAAAVILAQVICWTLTRIVGPLPGWLSNGILGVEVCVAVFVAGAFFVGQRQVSPPE